MTFSRCPLPPAAAAAAAERPESQDGREASCMLLDMLLVVLSLLLDYPAAAAVADARLRPGPDVLDLSPTRVLRCVCVCMPCPTKSRHGLSHAVAG